jgi:hypothetical protein
VPGIPKLELRTSEGSVAVGSVINGFKDRTANGHEQVGRSITVRQNDVLTSACVGVSPHSDVCAQVAHHRRGISRG